MYIGFGKEKGIEIEESDAFKYALKRISKNEDERKEFIEWFYSGNFIKLEDGYETI